MQWFYLKNGQQVGPVSIDELKNLLANGTLDPATDLVWKQGMPEWMPAANVSELNQDPAAASPAPAPALGVPGGGGGEQNPYLAGSANPYATPTSNAAALPSQASLPYVKPANYGLMTGLLIVGGVIFIGALIGVFMSMVEDIEPSGPGEYYGEPDFNVSPGMIIAAAVGFIIMMTGGIMSLIYLHRAWQILQPRTYITTPGKAVGFLFIPLFNLYWQFVAYYKWSQEWNRLVANDPAHPNAPRMTEGLFLTYPIARLSSILPFVGGIAGLVSAVFFFIIMKGVCDAVNYASAAASATQHSDF